LGGRKSNGAQGEYKNQQDALQHADSTAETQRSNWFEHEQLHTSVIKQKNISATPTRSYSEETRFLQQTVHKSQSNSRIASEAVDSRQHVSQSARTLVILFNF
jgi:hypothetical protein